MKAIRVAEDLSLPHDAASRTSTVLGQKGSGKTYLAMVITEGMLDVGVQVICFDLTGVWWGLKAEGTGPGFPILVMGGDHADVPLSHTSGAIIADFLVKSGQSVVLDLSGFMGNAQIDQFVAELAERLYALKGKAEHRVPMHLMLDEADFYVPQEARRKGFQIRMLGAMEMIVRRGRSRGLGMTMITQRAAALNKGVLEQSDLIVATRTMGKNDHAAIQATTRLHANAEQQAEFLKALPALKNGEAYFWSPEWLECFAVHKILPKRTRDTGKTPEAGERVKPPKFAKVDIAKLSAEIQATIDAAKHDDPKELKRMNASLVAENGKMIARNTELLQEIQKLKTAPPAEVPLLDKKDRDLLRKLQEQLHTLGISHLVDLAQTAHGTLNKIFVALDHPKPARLPVRERTHPSPPAAVFKPITPAVVAAARPTNGSTPAALPKGERALLIAAAQYPEGLTREQASLLVGIKRSTRDRYIQYLQQKGFVTTSGSDVVITQDGMDALGDYEPLPTGDALQAYWLAKLPEGEAKILRVLIKFYPDSVAREELDTETGLARSTRDRYLQYLAARKLIQPAGGRGEVLASKLLFD